VADEKKKSSFSAPEPGASVSKERTFGQKETGIGSLAPNDEPEGKSESAERKISTKPIVKAKAEGEVWTSKEEGGEQGQFITVLATEASVEAGAFSYDLAKAKAKVTVVDAKASVTVVHGQIDLVDKIKHFFFGDAPPTPPPSTGPGPMAARMGDMTAHGFPLVGGPGSPNVFIGGMPAWRVGLDIHLCPAYHGGGPAAPGASTVLINGAPAARAGDFIVEPTGGPDIIALGCPTVLIGPSAPPPQATSPSQVAKDPWVIFESTAEGNVGAAEAEVKATAEGDLSKGKGKILGKAEVMAAVFKGEFPLKIRIRVPGTAWYVGLGVKVEGTLLSAGAAAEGGVTVNDGKTLFAITGGAKAGAGIAGVGAKVSFDIGAK
jgi:uncharacterized Zn-binding protein involved in type VI secretion